MDVERVFFHVGDIGIGLALQVDFPHFSPEGRGIEDVALRRQADERAVGQGHGLGLS